jgi:hypothetical protein
LAYAAICSFLEGGKGIGFDTMGGFGTASRVGEGGAAVCETDGAGEGLALGVAEEDGVRTGPAPPEQDESTKANPMTRRGARRSPDRG